MKHKDACWLLATLEMFHFRKLYEFYSFTYTLVENISLFFIEARLLERDRQWHPHVLY